MHMYTSLGRLHLQPEPPSQLMSSTKYYSMYRCTYVYMSTCRKDLRVR